VFVGFIERTDRGQVSLQSEALPVTPLWRHGLTFSERFPRWIDSSARTVGREFAGGHDRVDHGAGEFAQGEAHVNTAESFFALLKRGIVGSFHHVSPVHLGRYCDEFSFRWDRRSIDDTTRAAQAIKAGEGKRLTYQRTRSALPPEA
jgi:hypothetical protein